MLQKVAMALLPKEIKNSLTAIIGGAILGAIMIPVVLIVAVFSPSSNGEQDAWEKAYSQLSCDGELRYQLEDVRIFESHIDPNVEKITVINAKERLSKQYLNTRRKRSSNQKLCFLKTDDVIINTLKKEYDLMQLQVDEMLDDVFSVRNGRQNLIIPLDPSTLVSRFNSQETKNGVILSDESNHSVKAIADGIVDSIQYVNTEITIPGPCTNNLCDTVRPQGYTITIKHSLQGEIKEDGDYRIITIYSSYSLLEIGKFQKGDLIKQNDVLGKTSNPYLYFEIRNTNKEHLDPESFIYFYRPSGELIPPFDLPIPITSHVGDRDGLGDDFHFGTDMDKGVNTPIKAIADGTVYDMGQSCSPYDGKLGNKCPSGMSGAGNYVVLKFQIEDKTYYAYYMHMAKVFAKKGEVLDSGDEIGTQGNSGNSTGSHLHLEIHENTPTPQSKKGLIDPETMIDFTGTKNSSK